MISTLYLFLVPLIPLIASLFNSRFSYYTGVVTSISLMIISLLTINNYVSFSLYTSNYFSIGFKGLSEIFLFIISVTEIILFLFSIYYKPEDRKLAFLLNLTIFVINSVLFSRNIILFLILWESMSISGYLLIGYKKEIKSYPAYVFYAFGELSTIFLTVGFAAYYSQTGSLQIGHSLGNQYILFIIFMGFIFKMGIVPLQMVEWLPIAHGNAPTSGSILFSASMTTVALYGVLLFATTSSPGLILGLILISIGAFSLLFGSIFAISSENSKMLPAYSTVENSGAMIMLTGLFLSWRFYNNVALYSFILVGIFIYATAHAWSKSTIFVLSSVSEDMNINSKIGSRLGVFSKFSAAIAAISLMGLLPLGGGIGEWFLLESLFISASSNHYLTLAVVSIIAGSLGALGAGISIPTFTKYFHFMTDKNVYDQSGAKRVNLPLWAGGMLILGVSIFVWFLVYIYSLTAGSIMNNPKPIIFLFSLKGIQYPFLIYSVSQSSGVFGFISPVFILLFIAGAFLFLYAIGGTKSRPIEIWNGGIIQTDEMNSFAYANVLRIILAKVYLSREEKSGGAYRERTFDIFWIIIVDFALLFRKFSEKFGRIVMNGNVNRYIAYIILAFFFVLIFVSF
ncbi:proton-conducting transporter membrane subunit [Cuniculiplasma sp. SKW4]|uniref:proton-conducting transporter transmembrane domain-containing protein n=1 Tax=Cuniculiplasma sp. SKW4 TaxID=3400171 RepID=UPI003FD2BA00